MADTISEENTKEPKAGQKQIFKASSDIAASFVAGLEKDLEEAWERGFRQGWHEQGGGPHADVESALAECRKPRR